MKAKDYDYLIDMLIMLGYVTRKQVKTFRKEKSNDKSVIEHMMTKKVIAPIALTLALATHFGCEVARLRGGKKQAITDGVLTTIPPAIARKYRVIPLEECGMVLKIAISDPSELATIDSLSHLLGKELEVVVATEADISWALKQFYPERPKRQNWWGRGKK